MKIVRVKLTNHPGIGDIDLDLTDNGSVPQVVVLAGGNGCGKTAILEAIQSTFGSNGTALDIGTIEIQLELTQIEIARLNATGQTLRVEGDAKSFVLTYDTSTGAAQAGWQQMFQLTWIDAAGTSQPAPSPVWIQEAWSGFMMVFSAKQTSAFTPHHCGQLVVEMLMRPPEQGNAAAASWRMKLLNLLSTSVQRTTRIWQIG